MAPPLDGSRSIVYMLLYEDRRAHESDGIMDSRQMRLLMMRFPRHTQQQHRQTTTRQRDIEETITSLSHVVLPHPQQIEQDVVEPLAPRRFWYSLGYGYQIHTLSLKKKKK